MSIIKKSSFSVNLDETNVFVNDTDSNSKYFKITQLPDTFTGGKNAFLLQGSTFLREDSYIYIEIKDSNGNVVYSEPAGGKDGNYYEGLSIPISVRVYDDTSFGPGTITIVGELKEYETNGVLSIIPNEWVGRLNVKWQKSIIIDPFKANTTPIRFYKKPKITINEILLPIYERNSLLKTYSGSFKGISLEPVADTQWPYNKPVRYEIFSINPSSASFINNFNLPNTQAQPFNAKSLGTILSAENILYENASNLTDYARPNTWNTTIKEIITPYRAIVDIPYISEKSDLEPSRIKNIALSDFTLTYESSSINPNPFISTSYADIRLDDLDTFSGDIHRVKIFAKSKNDLKGYSLLEDIVLENRELLQTDFFEGELNRRIGIFNQTIIDTYWTVNSLAGYGTAVSSDNNLINSVTLTPDVELLNTNGIFSLKNSGSIEFTKDYEYKLEFSAVLNELPAGIGGLDVYMSGSTDSFTFSGLPLLTFNNTNRDIPYGKKILSINSSNFKRFDNQSIIFTADRNGLGNVLFVVKNGTWELNNIRLKPATETAFSPGELKLITKPNIQIPNEQFDFRFEFFDVNYTFVPITLERTIRFGGGNDILPSITFINKSSNANLRFSNDPNVTAPDGFFLISTNSFTATPSYLEFDYSSNRAAAPFIFDSSSNTAYDRSGSIIYESDVKELSEYPGKHIDVVKPITGQTGFNIGKIRIPYENFRSNIINNEKGEFRLVDKVEYKITDALGVLENTNNFGKLIIRAKWDNFIPCEPSKIISSSVRHGVSSAYGYSSGEYGNRLTEAKLVRDWIYFEATNFPGLVSDRSWDEWIVWWSPNGDSNWYYGYNIITQAEEFEFFIGAGVVSGYVGGSNQQFYTPGLSHIISTYEGLITSSSRSSNPILNGRYDYIDSIQNNFESDTIERSMWYNSANVLDQNPPNALWNNIGTGPIVGDPWTYPGRYGRTSVDGGDTYLNGGQSVVIKYVPETDITDGLELKTGFVTDGIANTNLAYTNGYISEYNPEKTGIYIFLPANALAGVQYVDLRVSKRCHNSLIIDNPNRNISLNPHITRYFIKTTLEWQAKKTPLYQIQNYFDIADQNQQKEHWQASKFRRIYYNVSNLPWKTGWIVVSTTNNNIIFDYERDYSFPSSGNIPQYVSEDIFNLMGIDNSLFNGLTVGQKNYYKQIILMQLHGAVQDYFKSLPEFAGKNVFALPFSNYGSVPSSVLAFSGDPRYINTRFIHNLIPNEYRNDITITAFSGSQSGITLPQLTNVRLDSQYDTTIQLKGDVYPSTQPLLFRITNVNPGTNYNIGTIIHIWVIDTTANLLVYHRRQDISSIQGSNLYERRNIDGSPNPNPPFRMENYPTVPLQSYKTYRILIATTRDPAYPPTGILPSPGANMGLDGAEEYLKTYVRFNYWNANNYYAFYDSNFPIVTGGSPAVLPKPADNYTLINTEQITYISQADSGFNFYFPTNIAGPRPEGGSDAYIDYTITLDGEKSTGVTCFITVGDIDESGGAPESIKEPYLSSNSTY